MKKVKEYKFNETNKKIFGVISSLLIILIYYYIALPPLNITSPFFWFSIIFLTTIITLINGFSHLLTMGTIDDKGNFIKNKNYQSKKGFAFPFVAILIIVILIIVINVVYSPVFNSKAFANRINVLEDAEFTEDVKPVDFSKLALLDKDSSQKLGDRVMGQMPELVSQFDVSDIYTQINYHDIIERVTPLEYADMFKYFTNRKNGITGYIKVNSVTGEASLQKLTKGMKYVPSALFGEDLERKLRFSYPFDIFGEKTFEIDEQDNPYWIVPVLTYKGIGQRKEVSHLIIFNPVDGTSTKYKVGEVPDWVDHVYSAELVLEQLNDWGQYKNGFVNSVIGQKGVVATTNGYNYLVMNNDVYMTTGITSAARDESNIGFILTNLRTKETKFYATAGAEEYSAMDSAKGQVQQMNYTATFPILINLNNKPTYLISLKDYAGLVKMYAFVDLVDYQKVTVTDSAKGIEQAAKNYLGDSIDTTTDKETKRITIKTITSATIDSTTVYYLTDTSDVKYKVNIRVSEEILPFIKVNDSIEVTYTNKLLKEVIAITK